MRKLKVTLLTFIIGIIVVSCFHACSKDDGDGTATIKLLLKDAPGDYQQVNVEVIDVELHTSSNGWQTIPVNDSIYDLLLLAGNANTFLANAIVPASNLTQLRLILGTQNTVMVDSIIYPLVLSSQDISGLKINLNQSLTPGAPYTLVIDFDAAASVHQTGNGSYKLKPVLKGEFL